MRKDKMRRATLKLALAAAAVLTLIIMIARIVSMRPGTSSDTSQTPLPHSTATQISTGLTPTADQYQAARMQMVEAQMRNRDITDEKVLKAMEKVPRHEFVPERYQGLAHADRPLPIGYGQTISQPYIVALMTQLLEVGQADKVLEIGSGSGYQAAIMGELAHEVYTVEIIEELAESATELLRRLGYANVHVKHADGYYGWEEHAPYDVIIVTCAPDHIPQPLLDQLADGGCMVVPVGPPGAYQVLWKIEREGEEIVSQRITGVVFVPLTGEHSPQ
ncbi:MAG: protein-L-isoaspartate(D-aspartate) O-methyltransferase [Chloroflexota bacterium]|nr:protein-L-isoaspartate(D-aspartate) O-methyltransferase [Anaerolineae bacterium]